MITVAFTVSSRRPRYLRRAAESWARCRGEAGYLFSMEPAPREFGIAHFINWADQMGKVTVHVQPQRLGCNANTYHALMDGFKQSEFVVLAEEDIEVADDTLEFFTWASEHYRDDPSVLAVCAHVKDNSGGSKAQDVFRAPWFSPLVWGTWEDRWDNLLRPGWLEWNDSWDAHVRTVRYERDMQCVFPALSRSWHFGETSTMTPRMANGGPNYFHREALTRCYRPSYPPQEYREAPVTGVTLY